MSCAAAPLLLIAVVLPLQAWAFDAGAPLESLSTFMPAGAVFSPEPLDDTPTPVTTFQATAPATPAPVVKAAASAPKADADRRPRRQAERLDRPPFVRPM